MAGIDKDTPIPTEIKLHQKSRKLELAYASGEHHELIANFSASLRLQPKHGAMVPVRKRYKPENAMSRFPALNP
jgi:hypothetical protein